MLKKILCWMELHPKSEVEVWINPKESDEMLQGGLTAIPWFHCKKCNKFWIYTSINRYNK
jgi:hypothetical protein